MPKARRQRRQRRKRTRKGGSGKIKGARVVAGSSTTEPDESPVDVPLKPAGQKKYDILAMPDVQDQVQETYYDYVEPIQGGGDSNSNVVVFDIKGNDHHLCINDVELEVEVKMVGGDGADLATSIYANTKNFRKTVVEPQLIHSLWSRVEVKLNNNPIRSHVHHYGLKAYLDTLLSTSKQDQESLATTTLFEKEKNFDTNWDGGDNAVYTSISGRLKRIQKCAGATSTFILRDKIKHFLFEQKKTLLPRTDLQLELTKAKPEHYILSWGVEGTVPQIRIVSIRLWVKYQKLLPEAQTRVDQVLHKFYALIPLSPRIELTYLTIGTGISTFKAQAIFHGTSPTQVILAMVDGRNFLGSYDRSLFNFHHFDLLEVWFTKNGVRIPTQGYTNLSLGDQALNRGSAMYAWKNLLELGQNMTPPKELNITYEDWCSKGYTLFVFDFTPDKQESMDVEVFSHVNDAPINIHMQFRTAMTNSINVLLYSKFDSLIKLSPNKQATWNWA